MKAFKDLQDLQPRPDGYDGHKNGLPLPDDLPKVLTDDHVVEAYKVPWEANGHLKDADADFHDAVWGIQDGRRDARQMASIPEMKNGKK